MPVSTEQPCVTAPNTDHCGRFRFNLWCLSAVT